MADEIQDKLNSLLSDPQMMKNISSLAKSFGVTDSAASDDGYSAGGEDMMQNMQSLINSADISSDSRINLLNALKPYMRSSRSQYMDTAIRILKLTRISSVLKDI